MKFARRLGRDGGDGAEFEAENRGHGAFAGRYRFLHRSVVPAGRYRRQFEALQTVGSWSYVLAGPQVSVEAGYALAAALHRVEGVSASLAGGMMSDATIGNTLSALPRADSLQPGVEKYFREVAAIN